MNTSNSNRIISAKRFLSLLPFGSSNKLVANNHPNGPKNSPVSKQANNRESRKITGKQSTTRYGKNAKLWNLIKDCLASLLRTPPKKTILICAIALTLPTTIAIFSASFKAAEQNLLNSRNISVFLNEKISLNNASQLAKTLASNQHILTAELTPVAIQDRDILTIDIQPATTLNKIQLDNIVKELNSHTLVDFVAADSSWLQQNVEAINQTRKFAWLSLAVAAPITMVLAYLISFTDLIRQKAELKVLNQMGASRLTLLKPLLLRSLTLTLLALGVAALLAWGLIEILPHLADISTYSQVFPRSLPFQQIVLLGLIAVFSSCLTVGILGRKTIKSL